MLRRDGKPYTPAQLGKRLRTAREKAGLPAGLSAHGLRKSGAEADAEVGCSASELMALYGWASMALANHYTKKYDRRITARRAAARRASNGV